MKPARARAFTLVEAVLCTLIVGIILVAAIATVGAARRAHKSASDRAAANPLARDLLVEITSKPYIDPTASGPTSLGIDPGETPMTRSTFDDVDDYAGFQESPPTSPSGAPMPGYDKWTRAVAVEYASPASPDQPAFTDTGIKRITVTVAAGGTVLATRTALRTSAADPPAPSNSANGGAIVNVK
jgi:type II secretory pathway pseudopilin PulG